MTLPPEKSALSIRSTLMLWLSFSLVVVGILTVLANVYILSTPFKLQLELRAKDVTADLVEHLSEHIWNMDDDAIKTYFVHYPWESLGLVSVTIQTEYKDVLFEKTYAAESRPIRHSSPVIRDGRTIGFVEVNVRTTTLVAIRRAIANSGAMLVTAATIALFMVSSLIVNIVVVRPVRRTISGLRRIAGGEYSYTLPAARTRELALINREVNSMAGEISKRQRLLKGAMATREKAELDLRDLNEALEERIKKRTMQLRRLAKMLASAQDNEQQRIAEGLHDDVAQLLAAARMKMAVASSHSISEECRSLLAEVDDLVEQAYERLRLLSFELASSTLYQWGLKDSLIKLCAGMSERYGGSFEIDGADDLEDLDETSATVLFKSAREILFNVVKHSGVKSATIRLVRTATELVLTVEDRGRGFGDDIDIGVGRGLGLFSIKERLEDIEGELKIESKPGLTSVSLVVPWLEKDTDS